MLFKKKEKNESLMIDFKTTLTWRSLLSNATCLHVGVLRVACGIELDLETSWRLAV